MVPVQLVGVAGMAQLQKPAMRRRDAVAFDQFEPADSDRRCFLPGKDPGQGLLAEVNDRNQIRIAANAACADRGRQDYSLLRKTVTDDNVRTGR